MISVRSRPLLLSGNKSFLFLLVALFAAACSPKVRPTVGVKRPDTVQKVIVVTKPLPVLVHTPVISLLLPFKLDELNLAPGGDHSSLKKADMAVEYYQGFKLALDSLTALSYNFKLQVFDTRTDNRRLYELATNPDVRASDLVVGPIFADELKYFSTAFWGIKRPVVSPLSPSAPEEVGNANLVSVIPPLEYHAWHAADYIHRNFNPDKIFVLKSGYSEELKYTLPFKKVMDSLSNNKTKIISLTVTRGYLQSLLSQLSKTSQNVFVVPATNQEFLLSVLHSLDTLSTHYPVTVFGHPSWEKFSFLKADILQRLNTCITSSNRVNYKAAATIKFVKAYRKIYHAEPTEYAIKGFDEGMVFGEQVAKGPKDLANPGARDFKTLHNTFHFVFKPGAGWVNTHVDVLKYTNFELKPVE